MTMLRYNEGKNPLSLIPSSFIEAIFSNAMECHSVVPTKLIWLTGQVLNFGAQKYSAHNWRKGGSWSSVMNSALRHLLKMIDGQKIDPESNLSEAGHLGCNIAFLLEFASQGVGDDDRYVSPAAPEGIDAEPQPSLIWVLNELLAWRDGGPLHHLQIAAWELARWVEWDSHDPQPVPDNVIKFPAAPRIPTSVLPFGFPAFDGSNVVFH
jgi:hypothetical protein